MTIRAGLNTFSGFLDDIHKSEIKGLESKLKSATNPKTFLVEVIKTADKIMRRFTMHYPKTLLISYIVSAIFTVIFPGIGAFINLALNTVLFLRYQNYMFTSIKAHKNGNISEWFSTIEEKKVLEFWVRAKVMGQEFFSRLFS